jgi:hypothetical protein
MKNRITLQVGDDELKLWRSVARMLNLPLATWIKIAVQAHPDVKQKRLTREAVRECAEAKAIAQAKAQAETSLPPGKPYVSERLRLIQ